MKKKDWEHEEFIYSPCCGTNLNQVTFVTHMNSLGFYCGLCGEWFTSVVLLPGESSCLPIEKS